MAQRPSAGHGCTPYCVPLPCFHGHSERLGFEQLANPVQLVRRPAVDDARDRRLFDRLPCGAYPATNAHGVSLNGSSGRPGRPSFPPSSPLPRKPAGADPRS